MCDSVEPMKTVEPISYEKAIKWLPVCQMIGEQFSTCGKRQYGAIVLDQFGHVIGTGTNGGPKGYKHCVDGGCPRFQEMTASGSPYDNCIAIHAEENALLHSDFSQRYGGTIIVNGPPCWQCTKAICNSRLATLVHYTDPNYSDWDKCLDMLRQYVEVISIPIPADELVEEDDTMYLYEFGREDAIAVRIGTSEEAFPSIPSQDGGVVWQAVR